MEGFGDIVGPIGMVLVMAWIVKISLAHGRIKRIIKVEAELQTKLLDTLGSSTEVLDYLKSDPGARFLEALESGAAERSTPYQRVLGSVQWGIVLAFTGAALLFMEGRIPDAEHGFLVLGALAVALGLGFLVSGAVSFALAKSWGLLGPHGHAVDTE